MTLCTRFHWRVSRFFPPRNVFLAVAPFYILSFFFRFDYGTSLRPATSVRLPLLARPLAFVLVVSYFFFLCAIFVRRLRDRGRPRSTLPTTPFRLLGFFRLFSFSAVSFTQHGTDRRASQKNSKLASPLFSGGFSFSDSFTC